MTERIEYVNGGATVKSWLRYEYEGLDLLRIDERYDGDADGIDSGDPWRPMNTYVHGPGAIGQIVKANWYKYDESGANPTTACESGEYYYFYDALGNPDTSGPSAHGVLEEKNGLYRYYRWEMDAFGNDLPSGNDFLAMDQSGPKEHLTGKMFDTVTGLYYFHARWYDSEVGRFVGRDPVESDFSGCHDSNSIPFIQNDSYAFCGNTPLSFIDLDGLSPKQGYIKGEPGWRKNDNTWACWLKLEHIWPHLMSMLKNNANQCCQDAARALESTSFYYSNDLCGDSRTLSCTMIPPVGSKSDPIVVIAPSGCANLLGRYGPPPRPRCWLVHEAGHLMRPDDPQFADYITKECGGAECDTNVH